MWWSWSWRAYLKAGFWMVLLYEFLSSFGSVDVLQLQLQQSFWFPPSQSQPAERRDNNNSSSNSNSNHKQLRRYDPMQHIRPFWNCTEEETSENIEFTVNDHYNNHQTFIFVHVFKTAGSSTRQLLRQYGRMCHKSVAIVIKCSHVTASSLLLQPLQPQNGTTTTTTIPWMNMDTGSYGPNKSCVIKDFSRNKDARIVWPESLSSESESESESDNRGTVVVAPSMKRGDAFGRYHYDRARIIGGHFPLGIHRPPPPQQQQHSYQYMTFVRDPLEKYVSGRLFQNRFRNVSALEMIELIETDVAHLAKHGEEYDSYSTYLLTPYQKEDTTIMQNHEAKVQYVQSNLLELNVLVGVVERMAESLQLVQYVLDPTRERDDLFQPTISTGSGSGSGDSNSSTSMVRNKSKLSTKDLIEQLAARSPDFVTMIQAVLQSEYKIYNFAVELHTLQYDKLIRSQNVVNSH